MKAYKGFNNDLTCRGYQYEIGKEYETIGKIQPCQNGFHACQNPFDVLDHYGDILTNRYCEVEQSGDIVTDSDKTASSKILIKAEIGLTGLFKAGIEYLEEITAPPKLKSSSTNDNVKNYAKIGSSGYYAKIGSSGYYAQIGSSGDSAQIDSTGEDSVICCAGHNSAVKAKQGSWITLAEWEYSEEKSRYIPKCVKTEYVDGIRIKADTWYKLVNSQFTEI